MKHIVVAMLGLTGCIFYAGHAYAEWETVNCSDVDIKMAVPAGGTAECAIEKDGGAEFQNYYYVNNNTGVSVDAYYGKVGHNEVFTDVSLEEQIQDSAYAKNYDIKLTERGSANGYSYLGFTASAANRDTLQCVRFSRAAMRDPQDGRAKRSIYGFICAAQAAPLQRDIIDSILDGIDTPN